MVDVLELLADILGDEGENRQKFAKFRQSSPPFRQAGARMAPRFSPDSPLSPPAHEKRENEAADPAAGLADAVRLARHGHAVKFHSAALGLDLWLVADDAAATRVKYARWYDGAPVLTLEEVNACRGLTPDDLRELWALRQRFGGTILPDVVMKSSGV